jgi:hypothetical protein
MGSLQILSALVFEPAKAFRELTERPRVLFPLLLLIIATVGLTLWYYQVVDMDWLIDSQMRGSSRGRQLTEEQIAAASKMMTPGRVTTIGLIGGTLLVVLIRLVEALYYLLAAKVTNVQRGFKQWLSLACWTSLPQVLAVIPSAIVLLTTTTSQIGASELSPLSLNELFFHRQSSDPGFSLLTTVNLLHIASSYLAVLGVRIWSGRSWLFSAVFALLPTVLIFGTWAFVALG